MRALLDTDLILNVFLCRHLPQFRIDEVLSHLKRQKNQLYVTELCLEKISFYLGRNDSQLAESVISYLTEKLEINIIQVEPKDIIDLNTYQFYNLDTLSEAISGIKNDIDCVITLKPELYTGLALQVISVGLL